MSVCLCQRRGSETASIIRPVEGEGESAATAGDGPFEEARKRFWSILWVVRRRGKSDQIASRAN